MSEGRGMRETERRRIYRERDDGDREEEDREREG